MIQGQCARRPSCEQMRPSNFQAECLLSFRTSFRVQTVHKNSHRGLLPTPLTRFGSQRSRRDAREWVFLHPVSQRDVVESVPPENRLPKKDGRSSWSRILVHQLSHGRKRRPSNTRMGNTYSTCPCGTVEMCQRVAPNQNENDGNLLAIENVALLTCGKQFAMRSSTAMQSSSVCTCATYYCRPRPTRALRTASRPPLRRQGALRFYRRPAARRRRTRLSSRKRSSCSSVLWVPGEPIKKPMQKDPRSPRVARQRLVYVAHCRPTLRLALAEGVWHGHNGHKEEGLKRRQRVRLGNSGSCEQQLRTVLVRTRWCVDAFV